MSWELFTELHREAERSAQWQEALGDVVERRRRISTDMIISVDEPSQSSIDYLRAGGWTGDFCVLRMMGGGTWPYVKGRADVIAARLNVLWAERRL